LLKITHRQGCRKQLLEIINSNQAYQSAEIARFERWAKEFHHKPPMIEFEVTTPDGVPTGGDIVKYCRINGVPWNDNVPNRISIPQIT
jgi:hypothetical protein